MCFGELVEESNSMEGNKKKDVCMKEKEQGGRILLQRHRYRAVNSLKFAVTV